MSYDETLSLIAVTLRVATLATLLAAPLGIGLGYAFARFDFRGKALLQALVSLPMVLPPVAVGLGLLWLLGRNGPLAPVLAALGLELVFTWLGAAVAAAVVGFPLLVRSCEQAFAAVDPRFEHLARSLGHGRASTFRRVTLPLAQRGVFYGALLCFTRALGEFGATAVVAGIIPGRTETLALGIWSRVQLGQNDAALALCAASFALALVSMLVAEGWLRRGDSQ